MDSLALQFKKELNKKETEREKNLEKGRKNFRAFCNLHKPDFYKPERSYQDELCNTLQAAYEKKIVNEKTGKPIKYLIINLPPGFGKSYTLANFANWCYGQNVKSQKYTYAKFAQWIIRDIGNVDYVKSPSSDLSRYIEKMCKKNNDTVMNAILLGEEKRK